MFNSVGGEAQAIFVILELEILCPGAVVEAKIGNPQQIGAELRNPEDVIGMTPSRSPPAAPLHNPQVKMTKSVDVHEEEDEILVVAGDAVDNIQIQSQVTPEASKVDFEEGEENVNEKTPDLVPSSSTLLNKSSSSFSERGLLEATNIDEDGNVDSTDSSGHVREVDDDLGKDEGGGVDNLNIDPGEGTSMQANDATASSKLTKRKTPRSRSLGNYGVLAPSISIFHFFNVFALNFRMFR